MVLFNDGYYSYTYLVLDSTADTLILIGYYGYFNTVTGDYVDLNYTTAELQVASFTRSSVLSVISAEGLDSEIAQLTDLYSSMTHEMLEWLDALLDVYESDIELSDLGFISY